MTMMMNRSTPLFVTIASASLLGCATRQDAPWPTRGWTTSTPQAQGLDPTPLAALDRALGARTYGHVDRLVVVRNGYLVASHRYDIDYRVISRGRRDALGCGTGACEGWSGQPDFNYYDPDRHPYYLGRDIHTLQSVIRAALDPLRGSQPEASLPVIRQR